MDAFERDSKYIAHTYNRYPICIDHGKGSLLYDLEGREYIDMATGIAVNVFGVADEMWQQAVTKQMAKVAHTSNLYYTEPNGKLAELLIAKTGLSKVFFSNSGAEANECAIKAARSYSASKKGEDYYTIITLKNSFHGRTLTTLAATGQDEFHRLYQPLTPGFIHVEADNIDEMRNAVRNNKIAAIMMECIQGEGGVKALNKEFVREVAKLCQDEDIILIIDEVQSGNGRSGKFYSYMNYDITPDIVSTAKGLAGGIPIGATLLGSKLENVFNPGDHGSTFGGNPLATAAGVSIVSRIDDELLASVRAKGEYIFNVLSGSEGVKSVSGMGLMIGVETVKPVEEIVKECMNKGVLIITAHGKLRLLPALNIPMELLKKAVTVIKEACK